MIIEFTNPLFMPKVIKLAEMVPNTPIEKLKKFMFYTLNHPDTKAYIDYRDGEIFGFIYASIEEFCGDRCVFIQFCVIKPDRNENYVGFELLTKMKLFAKDNDITQIYFATQRDPKAWERKYKFKLDSYILKMELNKEQLCI